MGGGQYSGQLVRGDERGGDLRRGHRGERRDVRRAGAVGEHERRRGVRVLHRPTGLTYGILGSALSTAGTGLSGQATAVTGNTIGIRAVTQSPTSTAAFFDNLGGGKILSGRTTGYVERFSVDGSGNLWAGGTMTGTRLISMIATGTAPLAVTSTTAVPNLNADMLDGFHASAFQPLGAYATLGANVFVGNQAVTGNVTATGFLGDGSGLTGIVGGTGGVENTGSTTIGADTDADGVGEIALQTRQTTRVVVKNDGKVGIGTASPASLLDVDGSSADQLVSVSQGGSGSGITASTTATGSLPALTAAIVGTATGSYVAGVAGISTADYAAAVFGVSSGGPHTAGGHFVNSGGGDLISACTSIECTTNLFEVTSAGNLKTAGNANIDGSVSVGGSLNVSGSKNFKIDDPLDPDHKFLYHASVESSEMMNMYTGNVTTDAHGDAAVELPAWFQALNRDFRYQLTVIGQFAQAMVAQEIKNNRFMIKTDKASVKVSWQVTGVRHDAYAKAHPLQVEVDKPERAQ